MNGALFILIALSGPLALIWFALIRPYAKYLIRLDQRDAARRASKEGRDHG